MPDSRYDIKTHAFYLPHNSITELMRVYNRERTIPMVVY